MRTFRLVTAVLLLLTASAFAAQEQRVKARISNAGFTITALPLLAAKEWGLFTATTLNPTGIPTRIGMEILVRSIQSQGRHVDKKVAFADVADDRLATEVAKEMGYKIP